MMNWGLIKKDKKISLLTFNACCNQVDKDFSRHALFTRLLYLFLCGLSDIPLPLLNYSLFKKKFLSEIAKY